MPVLRYKLNNGVFALVMGRVHVRKGYSGQSKVCSPRAPRLDVRREEDGGLLFLDERLQVGRRGGVFVKQGGVAVNKEFNSSHLQVG